MTHPDADQMKDSTGLHLLRHVWENQRGKSWDAINHSMLYALRLAIGSHMKFTPEDFAYCSKFRVGYWLGERGWEYPYALAVAVENRSFIEAFEAHFERLPFLANRVSPNSTEGFTHRAGERSRERLALNFGVIIDGRPGEVSSITNEQVVVVLREFGELKRSVRKITLEACKEMWPAPKKKKAVKEEEPNV